MGTVNGWNARYVHSDVLEEQLQSSHSETTAPPSADAGAPAVNIDMRGPSDSALDMDMDADPSAGHPSMPGSASKPDASSNVKSSAKIPLPGSKMI